jgi:hypothetical protein
MSKKIQFVGKIIALVKYSIQSKNFCSYCSELRLSEMPLRAPAALVRKLVKFLFPLFGFLASFSEKNSASQKTFSFSRQPPIAVQLVKRPNYQRACLCRGRNAAALGPPWPVNGLTGTANEPSVPDKGVKRAIQFQGRFDVPVQ